MVQVKAWACELPATHELPLSRWSTSDLVREVCQSGLVASISGSTLWRWLHQDAIRPWFHRSWIFPRDPDFAEKAGRLLDLYARQRSDQPLKDDEFVISADEKTASKHAAENIPHGLVGRVTPCRLSMSMGDAEPGRISPLWTSTALGFSAAAKPRMESLHSTV